MKTSAQQTTLTPHDGAQTMNYIGQLAGQVVVTARELYKELNPATLTGCIDAVVVRHADGSFQCSPFHVRFGKLGVLRSREKVVDIEINGEPVDLHMKLGDNGEAFFVQEADDDGEVVPAHLATSPINTEGADLMAAHLGKAAGEGAVREGAERPPSPCLPLADPGSGSGFAAPPGSAPKRRRKRRKRSEMGGQMKKLGEQQPSDGEIFEMEMSTDEEAPRQIAQRPTSLEVSRPEVTAVTALYSSDTIHPFSDGEWSTSVGPDECRAPSPKSDSELVTRPSEAAMRSELPMRWTWGEFPEAAKYKKSEKSVDSPSTASADVPAGERPSPADSPCPSDPGDSGLVGSDDLSHAASGSESPAHASCASPLPADDDDEEEEEEDGMDGREDDDGGRTETPATAPPAMPAVPAEPTEPATPATDDGKATAGGKSPARESVESVVPPAAAAAAASCQEPKAPSSAKDGDQNGSSSKKKDASKRSRHQGPSDIYLDDLTALDPEVAKLYFPKREGELGRRWSVSGPDARSERSDCPSPRSTAVGGGGGGGGAVDSGTECQFDSDSDALSVGLSLCGGLCHNAEVSEEKFQERVIQYTDLTQNPALLDDPNLVIRIQNKYYNWAVAAPMILAMQAFHKGLPKTTVDKLVKDKMPKKPGRGWWFWSRKDTKEIKAGGTAANGNVSPDSTMPAEKLDVGSRLVDEVVISAEPLALVECDAKRVVVPDSLEEALTCISFKKSLRLSSEQIARLNLREGANSATFSITTQFQGTTRCEGTIYLWNWDDRVVISDIDGTITKSDTLGHILPQFGKDWTHEGIAKLYHKIHENGYKFLYCSARAIGMADLTRSYLEWVNEQGVMLPKGPLLLSPSSLFRAFHREVIEKKPEKFKIACLSDIGRLFPANSQPFYAAFGNRPNDVYAYRQVGVQESRIFTVNPRGELIQEPTKSCKSSYVKLSELVEHMFPLMMRENAAAFPCSEEFSQFTYWRSPMPSVDLEPL
uniref:phosphatidate phosphatase n=1 Tax=Petromyzon marinus TaxID=7757 RepID=A0AAJ7T3F1_PETMA|nr:phosphatidate phosphatase LPIN2-like isoform X3 [Petromyzon marinus]